MACDPGPGRHRCLRRIPPSWQSGIGTWGFPWHQATAGGRDARKCREDSVCVFCPKLPSPFRAMQASHGAAVGGQSPDLGKMTWEHGVPRGHRRRRAAGDLKKGSVHNLAQIPRNLARGFVCDPGSVRRCRARRSCLDGQAPEIGGAARDTRHQHNEAAREIGRRSRICCNCSCLLHAMVASGRTPLSAESLSMPEHTIDVGFPEAGGGCEQRYV